MAIIIYPINDYEEPITVQVDSQLWVHLSQGPGQNLISLDTNKWSDINAAVLKLVAEQKRQNDRSKTNGKTT